MCNRESHTSLPNKLVVLVTCEYPKTASSEQGMHVPGCKLIVFSIIVIIVLSVRFELQFRLLRANLEMDRRQHTFTSSNYCNKKYTRCIYSCNYVTRAVHILFIYLHISYLVVFLMPFSASMFSLAILYLHYLLSHLHTPNFTKCRSYILC